MSTFNAVNLDPQDEELEREEYSRELQVEEGFRTFQEALLYFNENNFDGASSKFKELFELDILKPNTWGLYTYTSPTLDSLRYLAYRNRGMFYYHYLIKNELKLNSDDVVTYILRVVEDLVESMQHSDADSAVTELLADIFKGFKTKKLQRLLYEYELTSSQNQQLLLGRQNTRKLLPQLGSILNQYETLLTDLKDDNTKRSSMAVNRLLDNYTPSGHKKNTNLNHVLSSIQKMKTQDEKTMKKLDSYELLVKDMTWESFANALKSILPHTKTTILLAKDLDPYCDAEDPIECLDIVIQAEQTLETLSEQVNVNEEVIEAAGEDIIKTEVVEDTKPVIEQTVLPDQESLNKRTTDQAMLTQRPVHRTSKRFKTEHEVDEKVQFQIHTLFFQEFTTSFHSIEKPLSPTFESLKNSLFTNEGELSNNNDNFQPHKDFFQCLKSWNTRHADIFAHSSNNMNLENGTSNNDKGDSIGLTTLLKANIADDYGQEDIYNDKLPKISNEHLVSFLSELNEFKPHFHEVRIKLLEHLLTPASSNVKERFVVDYIWSKNLYYSVEWLLVGVESNLYECLKNHPKRHKYFILSVFEMLVNILGSLAEELSSKQSQGSKKNEISGLKKRINVKVKKWFDLSKEIEDASDAKWTACYNWASYSYYQYADGSNNQKIIECLDESEKSLDLLDKNTVIVFPNYKYIPMLSRGVIKSQIKKINLIQKLTSISDEATSSESESEFDSHYLFLEETLVKLVDGTVVEDGPDKNNKEMVQFIKHSPFPLQIKLWDILYTHHLKARNVPKVIRCWTHVLKILFSKLSSKEYSDQHEEKRQQLLLTYLSTAGYFISKVVQLIMNEEVPKQINFDKNDYEILSRVFCLFYTVLLFETSSLNSTSYTSFFRRAHKSAGMLKEIITNFSIMLLYLFSNDSKVNKPNEFGFLTTNFILNFHALLGHFKFCDSSKGNFLMLSEKLLCLHVDDESYAQLKQILWCRYHYSTSTDNFMAEDHHTKAMTMDKKNSLPLGSYLIKLQYRNKNPLLVSANKSALKPIVDNIVETIDTWDVTENFVLTRNKYKFEQFMELPITSKLISSCLRGAHKLSLSNPNDELQEVINSGLYYVSSVQALNVYKTKKKSMQARPSELDNIVSMLVNDILYNNGRYESWYLLGKCYSYVVEDDLLWTSDKITVPEKKKQTANTQRKAILCYLMALNVMNCKNEISEEDEVIGCKIFESLGYELVSGYHKPLDKLCFTWNHSQKFLKLNDIGEAVNEELPVAFSISDFNIEQTILLCFNKGNEIRDVLKTKIMNSTERWENFYYISKIFFKKNPETCSDIILSKILSACLISNKLGTSKEQAVEPHYHLINMCYKLVKCCTIEVSSAMDILKSDNNFFGKDPNFWEIDSNLSSDDTKKVFYRKVIDLLRIVLQLDKNKWHHRPRYRIAKILFEDFKDSDGAIEEMDSLVPYKSVNKNLVSIWKPDSERPGKHFVYTTQYVIFFLELLHSKQDFNAIGTVTKKIKRFGSGMAYMSEAIDRATQIFVSSAAHEFQFDEKSYTERIMPSVNFQEFLKISRDIITHFEVEDYLKKAKEALSLAFQLKKANNGVLYDGVCISLYFKFFYFPYLEKHPVTIENEIPASPILKLEGSSQTPQPPSISKDVVKQVTQRKRVSKKDTFDAIKLLVEKFNAK